jgi:hypothetical protein
MKHYKDTQNNLFGYEDGDVVPAGLVEITMDEVTSINTAKQQAAFDALTYAEKRAMEYPPMSNYLDGVVKGDQAQIDAYVAACLAVKAKYPKEQA